MRCFSSITLGWNGHIVLNFDYNKYALLKVDFLGENTENTPYCVYTNIYLFGNTKLPGWYTNLPGAHVHKKYTLYRTVHGIRVLVQ